MIALTVAEVLAATGARSAGPADPEALITAVTADSRAVGPGSLFVALAGDRVDGHDFVPGAYAAGAVAALTARPVDSIPCLVVDDPLVALGQVARAVVDRGTAGGLAVVGITGSQGKTSTKDLLAQILEAAGPTVAPVGNLNNELGVPLTVARIESDTHYLVAEMGARGIGHIAYLCGIAPPRVGVVLNVGHAHVGEFGGRPAIAQAKGELVEALPADGFAVLNADDSLVWAMRPRTSATVVAFSDRGRPTDHAGPAVWASHLVSRPDGAYDFVLKVAVDGESEAEAEVQLRSAGRHQVGNAVAAAAAAAVLGVAPDVIGAGLTGAVSRSPWRMELHRRTDGVVVVNDAYNANPDSMRAAIDTLAELGRSGGGRTFAVLGDMLELGAEAPGEHRGIGEYVATAKIDVLVVLGDFADQLADGAGAVGGVEVWRDPDKTAVAARIDSEIRSGDVVLVKASRGLALNTVADDLLMDDPA